MNKMNIDEEQALLIGLKSLAVRHFDTLSPTIEMYMDLNEGEVADQLLSVRERIFEHIEFLEKRCKGLDER